ncbi:MAG: hypothetical protein ACR2MP_10370 [Streptosporangiaceae bacterium]
MTTFPEDAHGGLDVILAAAQAELTAYVEARVDLRHGMPEDAPAEHRFARLMNERRLALGLRWDQLADAAGVPEAALRTMRRTGSVPRELTQRGLEKALGWERGSVRLILAGGEPTRISDGGTAGGDASVRVLTRAMSAFERAIMDSDLPEDLKLVAIASHRRIGGDKMLEDLRRRISARRRFGG